MTERDRRPDGFDRRKFLAGSGAAVASAVALLEGCARREEERFLVQPPGRQRGLPGVARWRTSICGQCPAACTLDVRLIADDYGVDDAKKLEGHPAGPVNAGGVCALGHSALQELYHPDRVLRPVARSGGGELEETSWEDALAKVASAIGEALSKGRSIEVVTPYGYGPLQAVWRRFAASLGAPTPCRLEPFDATVERRAARLVLGFDRPGEGGSLPVYDLERSDWILSLGAQLVDGWRSPVHFANRLAERRARRLGPLVQVESRQSLTAIAADRWLALRPGTEGVLARALGEALLRSGRPEVEAAARYRELFPGVGPSLAQAAERCDLALRDVEKLVREMLTARRPVVVAGGSTAGGAAGLGAVSAGLALDLLLGAVGREGGVSGPRSPLAASAVLDLASDEGRDPGEPASLARRWGTPEGPGVVLAVDCDPVYQAAGGWRLGSAREAGEASSPTLISLTTLLDDTARLADVVLPVQSDLERLTVELPEPAISEGVMLAAEPAVAVAETVRHPGDVALAILTAISDSLLLPVPGESYEDVAQELLHASLEADPASWPEASAGSSARKLMNDLMRDGSVAVPGSNETDPPSEVGTRLAAGSLELVAVLDPASGEAPSAMAEPDDGSLELLLVPFESPKLGRGRGASRPWLQELPDPISSAMWQSWIEISSEDAEALGVALGDVVELAPSWRSSDGTAPAFATVYVCPATRPGTVAMAWGLGHRGGGRWAEGRGSSLGALLAGEPVEGVDVPRTTTTRVRVRRAAAAAEAASFYGHGLTLHERQEHIPVGWAPATVLPARPGGADPESRRRLAVLDSSSPTARRPRRSSEEEPA